MDAVQITLQDLEDTTQVLAACLTYFQAEDLKRAQVAFSAPRPSPLTLEIQERHERFRAYLGDYLLSRHEAVLDEDDPEVEEDGEEAPNSSENDAEALEEDVEALPSNPLGSFTRSPRAGRRLSAEEIAEAAHVAESIAEEIAESVEEE